MAEFLAGAAIAVEIIGPERLRAFGSSLHQESDKKPFQRFLDSPILQSFILLLAFGLIFAPLLIFKSSLDKMDIEVRILIIFLGIFFLIAIFWLALAIFSVAESLSRLADSLLKGIAVALEFPAIDKIIKLAALLLLLFGFHFDLLSS